MAIEHSTAKREINFIRLSREYDAYLNNEYVGSFATYGAAENELDRLEHEMLEHYSAPVAAVEALEGSTSADEAIDYDAIVDTRDDLHKWTNYELHGVSLTIQDDGLGSLIFDNDLFDLDERRMNQLRALRRILNDPRVAAVLEPQLPIIKQRFVLDDDLDERNGQEVGTDFICTAADQKVLVYFDDESKPSSPQAVVYAFGTGEFSFDEVERTVPVLQAVLNDPRVRRARIRTQAGLSPEPVRV